MRDVRYVGPLTVHEVVVDGWTVPLLHAHPCGEHDDKVMLVIDRRLADTFSVAEADRVVPFLADAIAVALGYTAHPKEDTAQPLVRQPHPRPVRTHAVALESWEVVEVIGDGVVGMGGDVVPVATPGTRMDVDAALRAPDGSEGVTGPDVSDDLCASGCSPVGELDRDDVLMGNRSGLRCLSDCVNRVARHNPSSPISDEGNMSYCDAAYKSRRTQAWLAAWLRSVWNIARVSSR